MPCRIAVIDDNAAYVQLMQSILVQFGYEVQVFPDEVISPAAIGEHHPDAIILDLHFGGAVLGWELLEQMRQLPALATIPIIVCSADIVALRDREDSLSQLGAVPLEKPFDLDELLGLLTEITRQERARG